MGMAGSSSSSNHTTVDSPAPPPKATAGEVVLTTRRPQGRTVGLVPGQSCCRKVYVATSRAAELDSPPPRGTELTITALKPGRGAAAGKTRRDGKLGCLGGWTQEGHIFWHEGRQRPSIHLNCQRSLTCCQGAHHHPPSSYPEDPGAQSS